MRKKVSLKVTNSTRIEIWRRIKYLNLKASLELGTLKGMQGKKTNLVWSSNFSLKLNYTKKRELETGKSFNTTKYQS